VPRLLFICSQNRLRSPTAEQIFAAYPNVETASAGTDNNADVSVTPELIEWADIIFVMEKTHRSKLSKRFRPHLNGKRLVCLDIPDEFGFMDPALISLLRAKVPRFLSAT